MRKKLFLAVILVMMFAGCSKSVSYKYNEADSQNGDWSVTSGKIVIREGDDTINFKLKYKGDSLISEGMQWDGSIMVCEKNSKKSYKDAKILCTRSDINGKKIVKGDTKIVDYDNDIIDILNDYDFSKVYIKIRYYKENISCEDIIEVSLDQ